MSKSELAAALDFAAEEAKRGRAATFLLAWESDGQMHVRTHPPSAALLRGVVLLLSEQAFPDDTDDDDADED
jgi:hypothetical protein